MRLFNANVSLRRRTAIFGIPALILLGLFTAATGSAHADSGSYQWVQVSKSVQTVVFYTKSTANGPRTVMAEIDGQHADHVRYGIGVAGHSAWIKLANPSLGPSYKLTMGHAGLTGCADRHPNCTADDSVAKHTVTTKWWSGHPGWKYGSVGTSYKVRVIQVTFIEWFKETCGTNC